MQPYQPMGPGAGVGPGPGQYPYPYPPQLPSAPRTLGLLSIIFGAVVGGQSLLGLAVGGSGVMEGLFNALPHASGAQAMHDYLAAVRVPTMVQSLMFVLMSGWLILIGTGLRRYRAWAARHAIMWGIAGLVALIGIAAIYLTVIGPAAERMMEAMPHMYGADNPMAPLVAWGGLLGVLVYAPFPIILIVAFRKPSVTVAMTT